MEWKLDNEDMLGLFRIRALDNAKSGQYEIEVHFDSPINSFAFIPQCVFSTDIARFYFQIAPEHEERFEKLFSPILKDIQGLRGSDEQEEFEDFLVKEGTSIFLSADVLRSQLRGFTETKPNAFLKKANILKICVAKDFSSTGAARTFRLDLEGLIRYQLEDMGKEQEIVKSNRKRIQEVLDSRQG